MKRRRLSQRSIILIGIAVIAAVVALSVVPW